MRISHIFKKSLRLCSVQNSAWNGRMCLGQVCCVNEQTLTLLVWSSNFQTKLLTTRLDILLDSGARLTVLHFQHCPSCSVNFESQVQMTYCINYLLGPVQKIDMRLNTPCNLGPHPIGYFEVGCPDLNPSSITPQLCIFEQIN